MFAGAAIFAAVLGLAPQARVFAVGAKLDPTGAFAIRWWTVEDGLPETPLTAIDIAADGAAWCATRTRLVRFDGRAFVAIDAAVTDRLRETIGDFTGLAFDGAGTLWVVGRRGAAARCSDSSSTTGDWATYPLASGVIEHVVLDARRAVCFVGPDAFFTFDGKGLVRRDLFPNGNAFSFYAATIDPRSDDVWVWARGAARRIVDGTARDDAAEIDGSIINLAPGPSGIWAGLVDAENHVVDGAAVFQDGRWHRWPMSTRPRTPAREGHVVEGSDGTVWLSTHSSIHALQDGTWTTVVEGLPDFSLTTQRMRVGSDGSVWLACSGGLLSVKAAPLRVTSFPACRVIHRRHDGTLLTGLIGEVVSLDEANDGVISRGERVAELPETAIPTAITETADGTLFVGTRDSFIYRIGGGKAEVVTQTPGSRLEVRNVHALASDTDGRVWAGTDHGVAVYNEELDCFDPLPAFTEPTPLPVIGLAVEPDGSLLVAVQGRGIDRLERNGRVTHAVPAAESPGKRGVRFCRTDDGTLWAAGDAGLLRWGRDGRKALFDQRHGLVDRAIVNASVDSSGRLWLAMRDGRLQGVRIADLDAIADRRDGVVQGIVLGPLDGLGEAEMLGGILPADRATLLATTTAGVVRFDPTGLGRGSVRPRRVTVAHEQVGSNATAVFRYATVTTDQFEAPLYQTRLVGIDPEWSPPTVLTERRYAAIPPGSHRFEVRQLSGDAMEHFPSGSVEVVVPVPFYRTPLFIAGMMLAAAGAAAGIAWWVSRVITQRRIAKLEQEQERQRDRARIARDIHDSLGAGLTQMAMMSDLMRRTAGHSTLGSDGSLDAKLDEMYRSAQSLTRVVDEIVWAVNPANDTLRRFFTFVAHDVEDIARSGGLDLRIDVDDDVPDIVLPASSRHHLCMLVREAAANVLKHARATTLEFRLHAHDGQLSMTIADDGQGFRRDGAVDSDQDGLVNMQARVDELGGTIEIASAPGQGTRVEVRVPLNADAVPATANRSHLRLHDADRRRDDSRRTG